MGRYVPLPRIALLGNGPWSMTSPFGPRVHPVTGEIGKMHFGIDIGCPIGTPILAPFKGRVSFVRHGSETAGNYLTLETEDGRFRVTCMHCDRIWVPQGARFNVGDLVALTGATGRVTGPHLHLEVQTRRGETWLKIDPMGPGASSLWMNAAVDAAGEAFDRVASDTEATIANAGNRVADRIVGALPVGPTGAPIDPRPPPAAPANTAGSEGLRRSLGEQESESDRAARFRARLRGT